jgi:hypothetical protein
MRENLEKIIPSNEGTKKEEMKKKSKRGKGAEATGEEDPKLEAELKKLAKEHAALMEKFAKL